MDKPAPTAYDILGVHPCAPSELVSSCYWTIAKQLQDRRNGDLEVDRLLHEVTRAYETLSDPVKRAGYNLSIGWTQEPLITRALSKSDLRRKKSHFRKHRWTAPADPYEVMGLGPLALPACLAEAHRIMREQYLRLPPDSPRRAMLLELLDESYAVLNDPDQRASLDNGIASRPRAPAQPGPAPGPAVVLDEPPSTQQVVLLTQEPPPSPRSQEAVPGAGAASASPSQQADPPPVVVAEPTAVEDHARKPRSLPRVALAVRRGVANLAAAAWWLLCLIGGALLALLMAASRIASRAWRSSVGSIKRRRLMRQERRRALQPAPQTSTKVAASRLRKADPNQVFLERLASTVKGADSAAPEKTKLVGRS